MSNFLALILILIFLPTFPPAAIVVFILWLFDCVIASQKAKKEEIKMLKKLLEDKNKI